MISITMDNFEQEVIQEKHPVLLAFIHLQHDFNNQIETLMNIEESYRGDLKICLINENHIWSLKEKLKVKGTPTFILLQEGREEGRLLGLTDMVLLSDFLKQLLNTEHTRIPHAEIQHPFGR